MEVATLPVPQHMAALAEANRIRFARANLKRRINAGEETVADVLEEIPEYAETMPVGELLRAQQRWAQRRTHKFLRRLHVNENRSLDDLTARQRSMIATELGE